MLLLSWVQQVSVHPMYFLIVKQPLSHDKQKKTLVLTAYQFQWETRLGEEFGLVVLTQEYDLLMILFQLELLFFQGLLHTSLLGLFLRERLR